MNSPLSGRSGTEKVTSRMTVRSPNRFVTLLELDDVAARRPAAAGSVTVSPRPTRYGNRPRWNQNSSRSMP